MSNDLTNSTIIITNINKTCGLCITKNKTLKRLGLAQSFLGSQEKSQIEDFVFLL